MDKKSEERNTKKEKKKNKKGFPYKKGGKRRTEKMEKKVNRKCKRCGIIRDSSEMYYQKYRKHYICNPTNHTHRAECSKRLNDAEDNEGVKNG